MKYITLKNIGLVLGIIGAIMLIFGIWSNSIDWVQNGLISLLFGNASVSESQIKHMKGND